MPKQWNDELDRKLLLIMIDPSGGYDWKVIAEKMGEGFTAEACRWVVCLGFVDFFSLYLCLLFIYPMLCCYFFSSLPPFYFLSSFYFLLSTQHCSTPFYIHLDYLSTSVFIAFLHLQFSPFHTNSFCLYFVTSSLGGPAYRPSALRFPQPRWNL